MEADHQSSGWFKTNKKGNKTPNIPSISIPKLKSGKMDLDSAPSPKFNFEREGFSGEPRPADEIWQAPSSDQIVETIKCLMMTRGSFHPIPISYNGNILHILEAYWKQKQDIMKKEKEIAELSKALAEQMDLMQNLGDQWAQDEKDLKAELKKMEVMVAQGVSGMDAVMVARSKSTVDRGKSRIPAGLQLIRERSQRGGSSSEDQGKQSRRPLVISSSESAATKEENMVKLSEEFLAKTNWYQNPQGNRTEQSRPSKPHSDQPRIELHDGPVPTMHRLQEQNMIESESFTSGTVMRPAPLRDVTGSEFPRPGVARHLASLQDVVESDSSNSGAADSSNDSDSDSDEERAPGLAYFADDAASKYRSKPLPRIPTFESSEVANLPAEGSSTATFPKNSYSSNRSVSSGGDLKVSRKGHFGTTSRKPAQNAQSTGIFEIMGLSGGGSTDTISKEPSTMSSTGASASDVMFSSREAREAFEEHVQSVTDQLKREDSKSSTVTAVRVESSGSGTDMGSTSGTTNHALIAATRSMAAKNARDQEDAAEQENSKDKNKGRPHRRRSDNDGGPANQ